VGKACLNTRRDLQKQRNLFFSSQKEAQAWDAGKKFTVVPKFLFFYKVMKKLI
jgi:hypothetical protein